LPALASIVLSLVLTAWLGSILWRRRRAHGVDAAGPPVAVPAAPAISMAPGADGPRKLETPFAHLTGGKR
jgi:hypothetical protein